MFAVVMGLFLIVAPLVTILLLLISLYVPLSNTYRRRTYLWTRYVSEWCMLDVFALAMMLYLSEQNNFVELTLLNGLWYLFGAVVVFTASLLWAEYASWRATSHRVSQIHDPTTLIGDAAAAAADRWSGRSASPGQQGGTGNPPRPADDPAEKRCLSQPSPDG